LHRLARQLVAQRRLVDVGRGNGIRNDADLDQQIAAARAGRGENEAVQIT